MFSLIPENNASEALDRYVSPQETSLFKWRLYDKEIKVV